jgi:hypothetical protein
VRIDPTRYSCTGGFLVPCVCLIPPQPRSGLLLSRITDWSKPKSYSFMAKGMSRRAAVLLRRSGPVLGVLIKCTSKNFKTSLEIHCPIFYQTAWCVGRDCSWGKSKDIRSIDHTYLSLIVIYFYMGDLIFRLDICLWMKGRLADDRRF